MPSQDRGSLTALPEYRSVLVPVDCSARAAHSLPHACALVAKGGTIHLVRILELPESPNPMYAHYGPACLTPEQLALRSKEAQDELTALAGSCPAPSGVDVRSHVFSTSGENVAERICQAARDLDADVLCMASHGRRGLKRVLLGSVAERVLRHSRVPTLVVRVPEHELAAD